MSEPTNPEQDLRDYVRGENFNGDIEFVASNALDLIADLRATIAEQAADKDSYIALLVEARGEVERLLPTHRENVERLTMENRRLRKDAARLQGIRDTLAQDKDDDLVRVEVAYFLDCNMSEIDDAG